MGQGRSRSSSSAECSRRPCGQNGTVRLQGGCNDLQPVPTRDGRRRHRPACMPSQSLRLRRRSRRSTGGGPPRVLLAPPRGRSRRARAQRACASHRTIQEATCLGIHHRRGPTYKLPFVIAASAAGTVIEWYDFYLYGVLAAFFSTQFFPERQRRPRRCSPRWRPSAPASPSARSAPSFFGRIGDIIGRKFTFLRHDHRHGHLDRPRRHPADVRPDRHPRADHPRHCCAWPRASRSAASTAARRSTSRSTPGRQAAASTPLDPDDGHDRPDAGPRWSSASPA